MFDQRQTVECLSQAALRQLLEFGLFHGDPHAGNIFAMDDGRPALEKY